MTTIGIILGSTRPGRNGEQIARWALERASTRTDASFELVDLADHPLPHLDEPMPPVLAQYSHDHTRSWSATVAGYDGFVVVVPEYNHSIPGVLKNALDYLYAEWNDKALGLVSYGPTGGIRAAEHLRLVAGELQMADVRQQVVINLRTDFEDYRTFTPGAHLEQALTATLDQVVAWTDALAPLRRPAPAAPEVARTGAADPVSA